ncbi:PCC domain-containing protein [Nesterenkonia muleiensis]|uniref:PCC domain-containing protein n=1 Tax=Nesterenkonia muleiensis TaxID=2282648 RepID=UPI000E754A41
MPGHYSPAEPPAAPPRLHHAGPPGSPRIQSYKSRSISALQSLRSGALLTEELLRITSSLGVTAAYAELSSGMLSPLHYCVPAPSDHKRCVSFSEERITKEGHLVYGSATIGTRDGRPFIHSHLHWSDDRGRALGGHIFPATVVGSPAPVAAVVGLLDAEWTSIDDPETFMPTFVPSASRTKEPLMTDQYSTVTVSRVLPNEDITEAVLSVCRKAGYSKAVVRAGLGSLIGARLTDATGQVRQVDGPGTEIITLTGFVKTGDNGLEAQLTTTLVDRHGEIHSGRLLPGENPVAVTFELTLQPAL